MNNIDVKPLMNLENSTYKTKNNHLILGEPLGLKDTINVAHPKLVSLFDKLKAQDWKEDELSFTQDRIDLLHASESVKNLFKLNIAYQFEIDSLLSENYATLLAPFVTDSQYSDMLSIIQYNEGLHYRSYLFIVRKIFSEPNEIFDLVLETKEVQERSEITFKAIEDLKEAGAKYTLGLIPNDQELYNIVFKGIFSFYILERFNFMSSFATTFIIPEAFNGLLMNSAKTVLKIALDEVIHWQVGEYVIKSLLESDPRAKIAFKECKEELLGIIEEAYQSEIKWSEFILSEDREVVGLNANLLKEYVSWNHINVLKTLGLTNEDAGELPLKYMKTWLKIDSVQHAQQEGSSNNYLLNILNNDLDDTDEFDY